MIEQKEATLAAASADDRCTHLKAFWFPPRPLPMIPQRIWRTVRCNATPTIEWVSQYCLSCGHHEAGNWCTRCLEANRFELEQCRQLGHETILGTCCPDSQIRLTFETRR